MVTSVAVQQLLWFGHLSWLNSVPRVAEQIDFTFNKWSELFLVY